MTTLESILLAAGAGLLGRSVAGHLLPAGWESLKERSEENSLALREGFVSLSPRALRWTAILSGSGAALLVSAPFGFAPALPAAAAASLLVPAGLVRLLRKRRREKLLAQLPATLRLLASSMRAGNSLPQAIFQSVPLLPKEMGAEADWVCRNYRLGIAIPAIFDAWERRMESADFRMVLRPLRVSLRSGGNVAELLDRCRQVLESRRRAAERLDSLTAQGRMQALVLSLLPPLLLLLLFQVDPSSRERLLGTTPGRLLLAASALLQAIGWTLVRRITRVVR
jgi:tight adherence protein B